MNHSNLWSSFLGGVECDVSTQRSRPSTHDHGCVDRKGSHTLLIPVLHVSRVDANTAGTRTRTITVPLPLAPPPLSQGTRTGWEGNHAINSLESCLATRAPILRPSPLIHTIKTKSVRAAIDRGHLRHAVGSIETNGTDKVFWRFFHHHCSDCRHGDGRDCRRL